MSTDPNPHHAGFMHSDRDEIWYRFGYALERVRRAPESLPALETLLPVGGASGSREDDGRDVSDGDGSGTGSALVRLLATGGARSLAARLVALWPARRRVGLAGLVAAGASGGVAALLVELVVPLARPGRRGAVEAEELADAVLEGVGRGLTYGGVVEPRLPGPAFLLGFVYGTAEYLAESWGGLPGLLRSVSPHGRIPFLSGLLEPSGDDDRAYAELVLFGLALATLYDAVHEKRGIEDDE